MLALASTLILAPPAGAAPTPPLGHSGRWITDAQGRVVILHGLNMIRKFPPYAPDAVGFGNDDADFLAAQGFNTMRIGFVYKGLEPQPGRYDDAYLARIADLAGMLGDRGFYPLVDFHQDQYNERFDGQGFPDWAVQDDGLPNQPDNGFPGNYLTMPSLQRAFDHFWANDPGPGGVRLQDSYAAAWRHAAQRLASDPRIVGYDVFNEPWPGSDAASCANPSGCPDFDENKLTPFSERTFAAIRAADPRRLLFYEPVLLFNSGAETHHGDTGDARAGMSFHLYCLGATPGLPQTQSSTDPGGCKVGEQRVFDDADAQAKRTGDALLLTEFGALDDVGVIARVADAADKNMVGWQEWAYWNRDPSADRPTEGLIRDIGKPPTPDNIKQDKLDVLVRAYPRAVAGTPRKFFYDRAARVFTLSYSTARAGGGALAPDAESEVWIPPRFFPRGYDVTSTGAHVTSAPDATLLTLRNETGARNVTLRVTPRGGPRSRPPAAAPVSRCFPPTLPIGYTGVGRARLGGARAGERSRVHLPYVSRAHAHVYCVRGGGRVLIAFSPAGSARLVATTARGHRIRGIGRGSSSRALRRVFPRARALRGGLILGRAGRARLLFVARGGHVRLVAALDAGLYRNPRLFRRYLHFIAR